MGSVSFEKMYSFHILTRMPENFCVFLPNQKAERRRPLGTGLVRHCPQGLFSSFFTFLRAIFSRPFRLSLAPTICPWVSEDGLSRTDFPLVRHAVLHWNAWWTPKKVLGYGGSRRKYLMFHLLCSIYLTATTSKAERSLHVYVHDFCPCISLE